MTGYRRSSGGSHGLCQEVVDVGLVDGRDGRLGIGVGGEQHPPGAREDGPGLAQELHAVHVRHALVGEQEAHPLVAQGQLPQGGEGVGAGLRPPDPVAAPVPLA